MILQLFFILGSSYCNSSTDYCSEDKVTKHIDTYVAPAERFFCVNAPIGLLFTFAICALPTLVFFLLSKCGNVPVSNCTFWINITQNFFIGWIIVAGICVFAAHPQAFSYFFMGLTFAVMTSIFYCTNAFHGCDYGSYESISDENYQMRMKSMRQEVRNNMKNCMCCDECCGNNEDNEKCGGEGYCETLEVLKQLRSIKVAREELVTIAEENALIPPTPRIDMIDFTTGDEGQLWVVNEKNIDVSYGSWQEEGMYVNIGNQPIVVYKCNSTYRYDEGMKEVLESAKLEAMQNNPKISSYHTAIEICETAGLTSRAIAAEKGHFVDCCSGCCITRFTYQILLFFGYSSIIDYCWLSHASVVEFNSIKSISSGPDLRAKARERDRSYLENYIVKERNTLDMPILV